MNAQESKFKILITGGAGLIGNDYVCLVLGDISFMVKVLPECYV